MRSLLTILKNILNKLSTIDNKKTEMKLLWTNGSPTSNFGAQRISISTSSEYDFVMVHYKNDNRYMVRVFVNAVGNVCHMTDIHSSGAGYVQSAYRDFTIMDDGLNFTNALWNYGSNQGWSVGNNQCVPLRVYGIKIGGGY